MVKFSPDGGPPSPPQEKTLLYTCGSWFYFLVGYEGPKRIQKQMPKGQINTISLYLFRNSPRAKHGRWVGLIWPVGHHFTTPVSISINIHPLNNVLKLQRYTPFSHYSITRRLGAFTAKSGRKHYNPLPLTVMWMNFDSPNFPSFCSLSAIISFQTCSNKCILYVLSFHKCIKIKYKMVNMYGVFRD